MKAFDIPIDKLILRYYLLMVVVIVPFFIGIPLLALLAVPVMIISILGVKLLPGNDKQPTKTAQLLKKESSNQAA